MKHIKTLKELDRMIKGEKEFYNFNGLCFTLEKINNDMNGNPRYKVYFNFNDFQKVLLTDSSKRGGRINKKDNSITLCIYDFSTDLGYILESCGLI